MLILVLVLMEAMLPCVIGMLIGMGRTCVFVHHGDKDAFLKGNVEPDPDEVELCLIVVLAMRSSCNK